MSINFIQSTPRRLHHYFIPQAANDHRPHFIRHKALHIYSALIIGLKVAVVALLFIIYPSPAQFSTITSNRIVELTNQARQQAGLPALVRNDTLDHSAMLKAEDMLKYNYFAHQRPEDGLAPWEWFKQAGYNYTYAGENLAMNFSDAEDAVQAWLKSPTHRANIMNSHYHDIGIAVVVGKINGHQTTLVVQHFGKSYVPVSKLAFSRSAQQAQAPQIAGVTQVSGGEAIEVAFKNSDRHNWLAALIYYSRKFLWVFLVFIFINLLLTIFIRLEIQHKPIIVHSVLVIIIGLLAIFLHPHFMEVVSAQPLKIL